MKVVLLSVLAILFTCTNASPTSPQPTLWPKGNQGRIAGGSNATRNQFPYQISLQLRVPGDFEHLCGGSILSPTHILTAGHCLSGYAVEELRVVAGILDINDDGVVADIEETLVHPDYQIGVGPNDLGLVRLTSALSFSESIQPINLPADGAEPEGTALLAGWGRTPTELSSDILQYVDVSILTYDECADALTEILGDPGALDAESNVCTGPLLEEGVGACSGDSGGPLTQLEFNEVIGIVSWGINPCGYARAPTVFTKVSSFVDFIKANVPDLPDLSKTHLK